MEPPQRAVCLRGKTNHNTSHCFLLGQGANYQVKTPATKRSLPSVMMTWSLWIILVAC